MYRYEAGIILFAILTVIFFQQCQNLTKRGIQGILKQELSTVKYETRYKGLAAVLFGVVYVFVGILPAFCLLVAVFLD